MKTLTFNNGTVSVGDVFVSSWGYEQTNVNFYQVISVLDILPHLRTS